MWPSDVHYSYSIMLFFIQVLLQMPEVFSHKILEMSWYGDYNDSW